MEQRAFLDRNLERLNCRLCPSRGREEPSGLRSPPFIESELHLYLCVEDASLLSVNNLESSGIPKRSKKVRGWRRQGVQRPNREGSGMSAIGGVGVEEWSGNTNTIS